MQPRGRGWEDCCPGDSLSAATWDPHVVFIARLLSFGQTSCTRKSEGICELGGIDVEPAQPHTQDTTSRVPSLRPGGLPRAQDMLAYPGALALRSPEGARSVGVV